MKMHNVFSRKITHLWLMLGVFLSSSVFAQDVLVSGNILDASTSESIIGANVLVKGTTIGTITDFDGNFSLSVPKDSELRISYIGYIPQVLSVFKDSKLNILLKTDVEKLDEVIVVGYATGSKRTVSGAIERIGKEDMNLGVVNNPLSAIKGKVAGVVIQKAGGDPAASPSIRIRGTTSLSGGNDPLVVIDGVFGDINMLNAISPADIQTFTILKDASETAQYGSRGASGVIVEIGRAHV